MEKKILPVKGVVTDISELLIDELHATFIKNWTIDTNANARMAGAEGFNGFIFTKLQGNERYCNLELPIGENYCVGYYHSWKNKKGYVFVWNQYGKHTLYRITSLGQCQVVYQNPCLNFQLDPVNFIRDGRVEVFTKCFFDKVSGQMVERTFICFTDFFNEHRHICEEDSMLTNSYDKSKYAALQVNDSLCSDCDYINLAVQPPIDCVSFTTIAPDSTDERTNTTNYKAFQFRIQFVDVWGRQSEWGPISDQYISVIGGGCVTESSGLPRCLKLSIPFGCAYIDKINLAIRTNSGNSRGLATESDWYLYDTIEKWDNENKQYWFERNVNKDLLFDAGTGLGYDSGTNKLYYKFCNNKECKPIPVSETNRLQNPQPRTSASLFGIGNGIGLARNKKQFQPMDAREADKLDFIVTKPQPETCSISQLRKIKVWGIIWNPFENMPTMIREKDGANVFGVADCAKNNPFAYDQIFPKDQAGFIGWLRGTEYYVVSKQYRYDLQTGDLLEVGNNFWQGITANAAMFGRYLPVQLWEFNVLPGKYIFQVSSHKSSPQDDFKKTSTYVIGRTSLSNVGAMVGSECKEILIGACDADVTIKDSPIMIYDLTRDGKGCAVADATSVNAGYIYESEKEPIPVERASVVTTEANFTGSRFTDHNGFYFAAHRARGLQTSVYNTKNCQTGQFLAKGTASRDNADSWYKFDNLYAYKDDVKMPIGDKWIVKGRITLCGSPGVGVSGVLVVMTNGGYGITDSEGYYRIVAHDYGYTDARRQESLIISQRGRCHLLNCASGCNYCIPDLSAQAPNCTGAERVVTEPDTIVNVRGMNLKGLEFGGRYQGGMVLHYRYGRKTYVQAREKHYFDIPSFQDVKVFDFCKLGFDMPNIVFPKDVVAVSFAFTENLNWDDSLTWAIERVQFVDATGNTNSAAPTQVRLYYEGLAEYNKQHNYATTTLWKFISNEQGVIGDRIEFWMNGDGTFFPKKIEALVKYDKEGKYIQVEYAEDMKDLKDGCLIKLIRPKQCQQKEWFYETCPIRVVNGVPATYSGNLNVYDRYFLARQIPVPVVVETKAKDAQGGEIVTSVTENEIRPFPFLFEHHSPSDFWGDHCHPKGMPNIKNPFEKEQCNVDEIMLSAASVEKSTFNGLSWFDDDDTVNFEEIYSGINMVFVEGNTVVIVCEQKTFMVGYNDNRMRVNAAGEVEAISLPNRMGKPQNIENYGCELEDLNTICRYNGLIAFLDRNNATVLKMQGSKIIDIAAKIGIVSYIKTKIKALAEWNAGDSDVRRYFHAIINPANSEYIVTAAKLRQKDSDYINDKLDFDFINNETFGINLESETMRGWYSFCPEYYGSLGSEVTDKQLFSFRFGTAWKHYGNSPVSNTFYGVSCNNVIEVVAGPQNGKAIFQSMAVDCVEQFFNADRVITQTGQVSRLMKSWWERIERSTYGDFKCSLNTVPDPNLPKQTGPNALLDGDVLYGEWIKIRLVGENNLKHKYAELHSVKVIFEPDLLNS